MLDYQTFFWHIVSVADLIASDDALQRAWVECEKSITSAFNYDELAQQVLDDQNIETEMHRFSKELEDTGALAAVTSFAYAFRVVDEAVNQNPRLQDPKELLKSEQWASLRKTAISIVELPSAAPFRRQFGSARR